MLRFIQSQSNPTTAIPLFTLITRHFNHPSKQHRHITKELHKEVKDFTNVQTIKHGLESIRDEHTKMEAKEFKSLSDMAELDKNTQQFRKAKLYPRFDPDTKKINKIIKKEFNKKIDEGVKQGLETYEKDLFHDMLPSSKENMRKIEELKHFNQLHFKKMETNRLLERERLKQTNFLPDESSSLNISYQQYQSNINELKNKRISNFLNKFNSNNHNKKLALLIQSGLMDKSVNIEKLIDNSLDALKEAQVKGEIPRSSSFKNPQNDFIDISPVVSEETAAENVKSKEPETSLQQHSPYSQEISQELSQIPLNKPVYYDLINRTEYDLQAEDMIKVNFGKVNEFLQEFVEASEEDKFKLLESLRTTREVRQYEEMIFDKYRNQDLTLRVKGRMKFEHLTETENINYIKYNIQTFSDVLDIWDNTQKVLTPKLANAMLQKITVFYLSSRGISPDFDIRMLRLLKDNRYRSLLRYMTNNMEFLSHQDFALMVYSMGKLHYKESGLIFFNLFEVFKERAIEQMKLRLDHLTTQELGFFLEGLYTLNSTEINRQIHEDHPELANRILDTIQRHVTMLNENPHAVEFDKNSIKVLQNIALYLAFRRTDKSISTLEDLTVTLERNIHLLDDPWTFMDLIFAYSAYALQRAPQNSSLTLNTNVPVDLKQERVVSFLCSLAPVIEKQAEKLAKLDDVSSIMVLYHKLNIHTPTLVKSLKAALVKGVKDYKDIHDYGVSEAICEFAASDIVNSNSEFKHLNLSRTNLIFMLFPKKIFQSIRSPQYIPYSTLAKIFTTGLGSFKLKNITLALFGLSSVKYYNKDLFSTLFPYLETKLPVKKFLLICSLISQKDITRIDLLSMLTFSLANLKINDSLYFPVIRRVFDIFNSSHQLDHATPHAIVQFLSSVANLGDMEGLLTAHLLPLMVPKMIPMIELLDSSSLVCALWSLNSLNFYDEEAFDDMIDVIKLDDLNLYEYYLLHMTLLNLETQGKIPEEDDFARFGEGYEDIIKRRKEIEEKSAQFEAKLRKDIEHLDHSDLGSRMSTEQVYELARMLFIGDKNVSLEKDSVKMGFQLPLYDRKNNVAIVIYNEECYLKNGEDLMGVFRMRERMLNEAAGLKIASFNLKEFFALNGKAKDLEELKIVRKNFLLEKISNAH